MVIFDEEKQNKQLDELHKQEEEQLVETLAESKYGLPYVERGGLSVVTSLDLTLQEKVQKIVMEEVENNAYLHLTNGAAMVTNPKNGDVLAMVGSEINSAAVKEVFSSRSSTIPETVTVISL